MARGKFVTFEGPEGSGKTTQAKALVERLKAQGLDVLYTREPGGTRTGEAIRGILQFDTAGEPISPQTEVLLFAASRAQLVRHVILPALEQGTWVVSDRFADSTTVYQGYGRGFSIESMLTINAFAIGEAVPDMTLLLDVSVDLGFERLAVRMEAQGTQKDRIEQEAKDFHERVRNGYLELAARWPERFCKLDGSGTQEQVKEFVWEQVRGLFPQSA
ncbi:MAG: dTMP kinase [Spartobacteria bacterium]|nr:dTMP kinase [Spartobacteria bacterium]